MGRKRDVADAEQQVADEEWKCRTCEAPAEEGGKYCMCCRMYWEDQNEADREAWLAQLP